MHAQRQKAISYNRPSSGVPTPSLTMPPMTAPSSHGRLTLARFLCVLLASLALASSHAEMAGTRSAQATGRSLPHTRARRSSATGTSTGSSPYDHALRLREALEGRPEAQRTRRDYDRVLDAFRLVYHGDPRNPQADASVATVAELLAEQGRLFEDRKSSLDAIGEYEFLRRAYPASRRRESALLTEGEIYRRDLADAADARASFATFLRLYPRSPLAAEAREGLRATTLTASTASRRTVLDAALASQTTAAQKQGNDGGRSRSNPSDPGTGRMALGTGRATPGTGQVAARNPAPRTPRQGFDQPAPAAGDAAGTLAVPPTHSASGRSNSDTRDTLIERDLDSPHAADAPVKSARGAADASADMSASRAASTKAGREPSAIANPADVALNATPPAPRGGRLPLVTGVRHWSTSVYTRVAIDLQDQVQYQASRAPSPDRIFFDLHGTRLSPELIGKAITVTDGGYLKRIRTAQFSGDVVRVVLDVSNVSDYSAFFLPNPSRLIIDIHGSAPGGPPVMSVADGLLPKASGAPPPATSVAAGPASASRTTTTVSGHGDRRPPSTVIARAPTAANPLNDIGTLDQQPNTVRATRQPTTAPVSVSVADPAPAAPPSPEFRRPRESVAG